MASETHSPLPWTRDRYCHLVSADGKEVRVSRMTLSGGADCDANEELILTAVNSHEALVRALKAAHEDMLDLNEYWNGMNGSAVDACQHTCEVSEKAMNAIDAALRSAGVEP